MVQVWQQAHLAPATIQTYRLPAGLAMWMGKHGFVRKPAITASLEEYQRHGSAQRDRAGPPKGIDAEAVIATVCKFDLRVGASLRLMSALGLRRKESVQFSRSCMSCRSSETGLPENQQQADRYAWVRGARAAGALDSPGRSRFIWRAGVCPRRGRRSRRPMGDPRRDLKA